MRWLVVLAIGCGSSSPPETFPESAYTYRFFIEIVGDNRGTIGPDWTSEHDYRADGHCVGRYVEGIPFRPRHEPENPTKRMVQVSLAPTSQIAVGVRMSTKERLLLGCATATLDTKRLTPLEVELK